MVITKTVAVILGILANKLLPHLGPGGIREEEVWGA